MKKYIFLTAVAAAAASMALSSCEDKKEPVYQEPTQFVLNTPVFANQQYVLENNGVIELTCSQPDYGFAAVANYMVDITLDDTFVEATEASEANYKTIVPVNTTSTVLQLNSKDIATAICEFEGIEAFVDYPAEGLAPVKLNVRARAGLIGVPSSYITSNIVTLASVLPCNPFPAVPGQVYLVGAPTGWATPDANNAEFYANWQIDETGVGTNIYNGSLEIPAGEQYFRFYKDLTGWGDDNAFPSFGPYGVDGENMEITITGDPQVLSAVPGKGSWYTSSDWAGGSVTFNIDMRDPQDIKVTVKSGVVVKEAYVYLVGNPSGWTEPSEGNMDFYADWRLVDRGITGVYTNTFDVAAGDVYFRIYPELTGWSATPYAASAADENIDMTLDTPYDYFMGVGNWKFDWTGGELIFTLDTNTGKMTVSPAEQ